MSHLSRSSSAPRHLLRDSASGHLVFPWKRNQRITWTNHRADVVEDLSEEWQTEYVDGENLCPTLPLTQSQIAALARSRLAVPWPQITTGYSYNMSAEASVQAGPTGEWTGYHVWSLFCRATRCRIANAGLAGIESLTATVSNVCADAGAGSLLLGWRFNAGSDDPPSAVPNPSDMDEVRTVTADATIPVVSSPTSASAFEIYAWVADAKPPSGPYERYVYIRDAGYPHYCYSASFRVSMSGNVIVNA